MKNVIFELVEKIYRQCDGDQVHGIMSKIAAHHRIQASEGYRQAADEACEMLRQEGIKSEVHSYPADLKHKCFTQKLFREWNCQEAYLDLTFPEYERAALFSEEEMSLIQRSAAGDYREKDIPILYVPDDVSPEDYTEDITDRIVFVENGFARWERRLQEGHAAAVLTVSMPEIPPVRVEMSEDPRLKDARANLSFHHYTTESETGLRGFVLTPSFGKRLKEMCLKLAQEGKYPTARFYIDSEIKDGGIENVESCIPGSGPEEILMTAHLCHPRSSVNDNASGAACAIAALSLLQRMIQGGILPSPRRTIRMLLIPEFTGAYAWLSEHEDQLEDIVGGFNMDMVAGKQDKDAGALLLVDTPDCAHSFSGDLGEAVLEGLSRECAFGGKKVYVPLFSSRRVPFVFGSDHYILSDPTIDIPTVALTQWPDKTYHTSADDAAHVDPMMLRRATAAAAAYCYLYADMDTETVKELLPYTARRFFGRIDALRREDDTVYRQKKAGYLKSVIDSTLNRYRAILPEEERDQADRLLGEEEKQYAYLLEPLMEDKKAERPEGRCPKRLFRGPAAMRSVLAEMDEAHRMRYEAMCRKYPVLSEVLDYIFYETDGSRTVEEIADIVQYQTDVDSSQFLEEFYALFEELDLISW